MLSVQLSSSQLRWLMLLHQGEDATSEGMDLDSAEAKAATAEVAEEQAAEEAGEKSIEEIASES